MNKNITNVFIGFAVAGLVLIGTTNVLLQTASAQTSNTKKTTVVKKPAPKVVQKKVIKKPATKVPVKPAPKSAPVAQKFLKAGWIPYWTKTAGSTETTDNLSKLDIISPFSYYVDEDGLLVDRLKVNAEPWPTLFKDAKANKIKIYPTIAWFDRAQMENILNDPQLRKRHIDSIESTILNNASFDGVDIDYENKSYETQVGFSSFIKELSVLTKAKNKKLICTIEPRTPIESRVRVLTPEKLADSKLVANDYAVIGKYCDQVRIMTYDQRDADIALHDKHDKIGTPYMPVADPEWVEKVIQLTIKEIPASKIMLGIPTFGYKWELVPDQTGGYNYTKLRAINFNEAFNNAKARGINIERNRAGELSYMYYAPESPSYAGATGAPLHLVWFPDAESMIDEIALAKKYKLGGISVFKFDGGADQSMWDVLNQK